MVSYIVIGRNEGWKLKKCFGSIKLSIKENDYIKSEVIYIDSASEDDSIKIAKSFGFVKVYKLTSDYNAAIARNVGAVIAQGSILFFIDGDMEINPEFLKNVLNINNKLTYGFIGGYYIGRYFDNEWNYLYERNYPSTGKIKHGFFEPFTGGLFIIEKRIWDEVSGMKPYLSGGADPEIAFRLARNGVYKLWIHKPMAVHYTIKNKRTGKVKHLFKRRNLVGNILIYRENITCFHALKRMLRQNYMAFILMLLLFSSLFYISAFPFVIAAYILMSTTKSIVKYKNIKSSMYFIVKDLIFILGMLFYWPNKKVDIEYKLIK
ncbi:MAG: glycosyltransferase family 2 protein [Bacteroidota bacterium]